MPQISAITIDSMVFISIVTHVKTGGSVTLIGFRIAPDGTSNPGVTRKPDTPPPKGLRKLEFY